MVAKAEQRTLRVRYARFDIFIVAQFLGRKTRCPARATHFLSDIYARIEIFRVARYLGRKTRYPARATNFTSDICTF